MDSEIQFLKVRIDFDVVEFYEMQNAKPTPKTFHFSCHNTHYFLKFSKILTNSLELIFVKFYDHYPSSNPFNRLSKSYLSKSLIIT